MYYFCYNYKDKLFEVGTPSEDGVNHIDYLSTNRIQLLMEIEAGEERSLYYTGVVLTKSPVVSLVYGDREKLELIGVIIDDQHSAYDKNNFDVYVEI